MKGWTGAAIDVKWSHAWWWLDFPLRGVIGLASYLISSEAFPLSYLKDGNEGGL